jgi:perosamine synthetase
LGKEEKQAAARVIDSGWLAQHSEVDAFEDEFCEFLGLPPGHAVALSSGTAALFLALWVLQARNKRVSLPVYSCSALRNAVGMAGGIEVLLDVVPNSPNINPVELGTNKSQIALVPHMYGLPVNITEYGNSVEIIEDCAQSLGAKVAGAYTGLLGKVGIYSFYATKLMTSGGQGGMLVSKDKALVEGVRDYRNFDGRCDCKHRFNFQMTDLQAAVGRVQLRKLPFFLSRRSEIFDFYKEAGLPLLDIEENHIPVRYRAVLKTSEPRRVIRDLSEKGIKSIIPIEDWELLGKGNLFPNAYKLSQETISLPLYPSLSTDEINTIAGSLDKV